MKLIRGRRDAGGPRRPYVPILPTLTIGPSASSGFRRSIQPWMAKRLAPLRIEKGVRHLPLPVAGGTDLCPLVTPGLNRLPLVPGRGALT